jgi:hypothetical protein
MGSSRHFVDVTGVLVDYCSHERVVEVPQYIAEAVSIAFSHLGEAYGAPTPLPRKNGKQQSHNNKNEFEVKRVLGHWPAPRWQMYHWQGDYLKYLGRGLFARYRGWETYQGHM